MKSWRTVAVLLLCLALASSVACGSDSESEVEQQLVEVVRGDLTFTVSGSGNMEVSSEARLAFGSGGKVDKIYVEEGDEVSKGEVLARLDTGSLELALTRAKLAMETAEYNLDKAQDIYTKPDIQGARAAVHEAQRYLDYAKEKLNQAFTAKEMEKWAYEVHQAELNLNRAIQRRDKMLASGDAEEVALKKLEVEAARQAVAEAQRQLDEATITAPFDGIVASVDAKEQDVIPPPTLSALTVIHLIDPTSMELEAEVDEIDIPLVKPNQRTIIEVDALPALELEGRVISIKPLPIEEAGVVLYKVKIEFDVPKSSELRVRMSAEADIVIAERSNVLLVPNRAIKQDSQGKPVVRVMVDKEIEERSVVIGISDDFQTEIVSGLSEGEIVVEN